MIDLLDYTALRAYTGADTQVHVTGNVALNVPAWGEGIFTYDSGDTTSADNGGTIIVITSGVNTGKRFKRQIAGNEVRPEWWRAAYPWTSAVQRAFNYAADRRGTVVLSAFAYPLESKITVSGSTTFSVIGQGPEVSMLVFTDYSVTDCGLDITVPARTDPDGGTLTLHNFSIHKESDRDYYGGTGLKITTGTVSGGDPCVGVSLDHIAVGGAVNDSTTNQRFVNGIHLVNCWQGQLANIAVVGPTSLHAGTDNFGIHFEDSTGCRCVNTLVYNQEHGYYVTGSTEGPTLVNAHAVSCRDGVYVTGPADEDNTSNPGLDLSNCHFNVTRYGIYAENRAQGIVHGCLFYEFDNDDESVYKCIYTDGTSRQWVISNNVMTAKTGTSATDKIAVHFDGTSDNIIQGNQIRASTFTRGVYFAPSVTRSACLDNWMDATSSIQFLNSSTTPDTIRYRGGYAGGVPSNLYGITAQSIPNSTGTALTLDATGGAGIAGGALSTDGSISNARWTVPTYAKRVRITGNLTFASNATGTRLVSVKKNGTSAVRGCPIKRVNACSAGTSMVDFSTAVLDVVPGDYFVIAVTQTSGAALLMDTDGWVSFEVVA